MRAALPALLALGAAVATPTPPPAAPGGAWVLVQRDGTRVTFGARPRARDGRLVGRLRESGALVSIPEAKVDAEATARANSPVGPAAIAPARPARRPRPFETPPLGDVVRLTKTGEEARRLLEAARSGSPAARPVPSATSVAGATPGESPPTDRLGRGEDYWRERAGVVRREAEETARELAVAEASLEAAERAYLGGGEAERTTFVLRVLEARERAAAARREQERASARWETLQEEARKAGAFPGWLR